MQLPATWQVVSISDLDQAKRGTIDPEEFPNESFEYYSIPAYQESGVPAIAKGSEIASVKLLLEQRAVLFGKLNPRVEKVWRVLPSTGLRQIGSTEWLPIVPRRNVDPDYLYFLCWSDHVIRTAKGQVSGSTPSRQRVDPAAFYRIHVPLPPLDEQRLIAAVLSRVQQAIERQGRLIALAEELRKALMHRLFTEGTRGELLKDTGIGPMPKSWEPVSLGVCCDVVSSSMSYSDFERQGESSDENAVLSMAVKVSDMNLAGNEEAFVGANVVKRLSTALVTKKLIPPNCVVLPKRGAAIATNKKRLTTTWTALDPNLIGIRAKSTVDPRFLFHWLQIFDLRRITDPGPTPQLNKKDLVPVKIPLPTLDEQRLVATVLDACTDKLKLHLRTQVSLSDLFRTLLNQLMTAQVRVQDLDLSTLGIDGSVDQPAGAV